MTYAMLAAEGKFIGTNGADELWELGNVIFLTREYLREDGPVVEVITAFNKPS